MPKGKKKSDDKKDDSAKKAKKVKAAKGEKVAKEKTAVKKAPAAKKAPASTIAKTISIEEISLRAYFIAERRQAMGWPGDSAGDWVEAERQIKAEAAQKAKGQVL